MCVASSRKPHPPGGPRAAFHAGHIAAPHHRGAADHLLSEVNRAAPGRRLPSVCLLRLDPRLIFLSRLKPLSEHEIERVRSGHRGGGGLETGGVQRLMGKQLHLQRARAKNSRVRSGHSQSFAGRQDGGMRRSSFASLRWLILVLVFAVCLLYVLNCLCSVDQISALCLLFAFSTPPTPTSSPPRLLLAGSKTTGKPWLPPWTRRFQMASWKNKVVLWSGQWKGRKSASLYLVPPSFYFNCKFPDFL